MNKGNHPQRTGNSFQYNTLPKHVSRKDFNRYVAKHLSYRKRGPKPKISYYKIFNYILYVLHTGIQWRQLKTYKNELHWSKVYKFHNRWSKDGSYKEQGKIDLGILHGDGSNTVAKKGARR